MAPEVESSEETKWKEEQSWKSRKRGDTEVQAAHSLVSADLLITRFSTVLSIRETDCFLWEMCFFLPFPLYVEEEMLGKSSLPFYKWLVSNHQ